MNQFYEEYKWARRLGHTPEQAIAWARLMRACDYSPFVD